MRRNGVVVISTLVGVAAIAAAGAASAGFGSQSSVRSFAHLEKRIVPSTTGTTAAGPGQLRGVNFVSGCRFSHRNTDDPIVYPGQPGRSHDHTFIGNDTTNAFSTLASLQGRSSSCRRAGDTAAYWVPTLISASGQMVLPRAATVYYRRHTLAPVQAFPPGFRVVAGNSKATGPSDVTAFTFSAPVTVTGRSKVHCFHAPASTRVLTPRSLCHASPSTVSDLTCR